MSEKNNEEKRGGPHGPDCHCDDDPDFEKASEGMTLVLAELLPNLMSAWAAGMPGVSVDFRFDRSDEEFAGITLRAKILEEVNWPDVPSLETMVDMASDADPDGFMHWKSNRPDGPPHASNGKGIVH